MVWAKQDSHLCSVKPRQSTDKLRITKKSHKIASQDPRANVEALWKVPVSQGQEQSALAIESQQRQVGDQTPRHSLAQLGKVKERETEEEKAVKGGC